MTPKHSGKLFVVGLGPGSPGLLTPDAAAALAAADTVVGYSGYLDLVAPQLEGKCVVARPLGEETERAETALQLAHKGHTVALVSSGDAGVYGMGGLACELAAREGVDTEIVVVPGITAALSAAARLGAPLAHDWACISLSDLLTPWDVIERRVDAAARADFVVVFYNPASRTRTQQLALAAERMLAYRNPETPVGLVENAYRPGERVQIASLQALAKGEARATMFTTVIVGSSQTYVAQGRMITPRIDAAKQPRNESRGTTQAAQRSSDLGSQIMEESFSMIDRELGPQPADAAERAVVKRMIHASADFDYASATRFGAGAIREAIAAFRKGAPVLTDVEMLRAGIRRELAAPLGVEALCCLNNRETVALADAACLTRSAAAMRLAARRVGDGAIVAIGNAPTALEECLRLVHEEHWRPACVVGIPVGFVGVVEAKRKLIETANLPYITALGRKGGTAVTAAAINALLDLAARGRDP